MSLLFMLAKGMHENRCIAVIVCKLAPDKKYRSRGYIGMLVVQKEYRKLGIGELSCSQSAECLYFVSLRRMPLCLSERPVVDPHQQPRIWSS